jgi:hypothetical protein
VLGSALLPLCYRPATWPATTCNHLQPPATRPGARHPRTYRVCSATPRLRTSLSCPECCHDTTADTARRGDEPQCTPARQHLSSIPASQHPSTRATKLCSALFSFRPVPTHCCHFLPACLLACLPDPPPSPSPAWHRGGPQACPSPPRYPLFTQICSDFSLAHPDTSPGHRDHTCSIALLPSSTATTCIVPSLPL